MLLILPWKFLTCKCCDTRDVWRQQLTALPVALTDLLQFLILPCGIIRGALANLGVTAVITADISTVPSCIFNIKIKN